MKARVHLFPIPPTRLYLPTSVSSNFPKNWFSSPPATSFASFSVTQSSCNSYSHIFLQQHALGHPPRAQARGRSASARNVKPGKPAQLLTIALLEAISTSSHGSVPMCVENSASRLLICCAAGACLTLRCRRLTIGLTLTVMPAGSRN